MSACDSGAAPVLRTRTLYCPEVPVTVQTSTPEAAGEACAFAIAAQASSAARGRNKARRDREGTARSW
ncbi:hypothetical protein D3C72_1758120 [compost metagenome]